MDPWTPEDRNAFIRQAVHSDGPKGAKGPYHFHTFPKVMKAADGVENGFRAQVTDVLAKTIYETNPAYRRISLQFYSTLMYKLAHNPRVGMHLGSDVIVLMKGSNAYAYVTGDTYGGSPMNQDREAFPFSDMDLVVCINPYISQEEFNELHRAVKIVVLQTISQYKRLIDHTFFVNKSQLDERLLDEKLTEEFKGDFAVAVQSLSTDTLEFQSPFESDEIRNSCSRHSFILTNSIAKENTVVKVEVPHYDKCERIPLRRTPCFSSYNETIDFKRDEQQDLQGHFDLYRLRINVLCTERDETGTIVREDRVTADFIDVSIASKNDSELIDFWNNGRCLSIYDRFANVWLTIPDLKSCINDLYKMLHVYECPENKKQKRQIKYNKLKEIAATWYQE